MPNPFDKAPKLPRNTPPRPRNPQQPSPHNYQRAQLSLQGTQSAEETISQDFQEEGGSNSQHTSATVLEVPQSRETAESTSTKTFKTPQTTFGGTGGSGGRGAIRVGGIIGRFCPVTVHQLVMAWWLYQSKHITKQQLRIYFAAHEMHEKRRYTKTEPEGERWGGSREKNTYGKGRSRGGWDYRVSGNGSRGSDATNNSSQTSGGRGSGASGGGGRKPLYTLAEIRKLIGGARTDAAQAALSADVKRLGRLGLVQITPHRIAFARSIEQIDIESISGFWQIVKPISVLDWR